MDVEFIAQCNWMYNGYVSCMSFNNKSAFTNKISSRHTTSHAVFENALSPTCNFSRNIASTRPQQLLIIVPLHKGRYIRGVLLPVQAPGSFFTCQYTRGSVFKFAQFAPGACSQIFNRLNIVEHFAGWKFCSRGWSIPMKWLVHTEELCYRSVPLDHAPGAKSLVCIGLKKSGTQTSTQNGLNNGFKTIIDQYSYFSTFFPNRCKTQTCSISQATSYLLKLPTALQTCLTKFTQTCQEVSSIHGYHG